MDAYDELLAFTTEMGLFSGGLSGIAPPEKSR